MRESRRVSEPHGIEDEVSMCRVFREDVEASVSIQGGRTKTW